MLPTFSAELHGGVMAVIWGDAQTGPDGSSGSALAGQVPWAHRVARAASIGAAAVYAVELEASIALPRGSLPGRCQGWKSSGWVSSSVSPLC
jgi:hypothetical protein